MITQLVILEYGDDARSVTPAQGDWGIDVIVGHLTSGFAIFGKPNIFPRLLATPREMTLLIPLIHLEEKVLKRGLLLTRGFFVYQPLLPPEWNNGGINGCRKMSATA